MLRHLPNLITLARMGLCLPLAWAILDGQPLRALWLAAAIGMSDVLDGLLARRFGWQSRLGGLLDPLADKLFLVSALVALAVAGVAPAWFVVLALLRDLVIVAGAVAYHNLVEPVQPEPRVLGKLNTLGEVLLVLVLLATMADWPLPGIAAPALLALVTALIVVSGADYVRTWSYRAMAIWQRRRESR
ncbi:MAG: CDP-alcohol phosphatidyltransferase family protein [Xanthomonadales bacterium]|nr:CDP-alcohol phosphatidyltransferase family protein [Xanthomonadales bacterium]